MVYFISLFCVGICADLSAIFRIIWLLIGPTTYLISRSRNEMHIMIMTCMYACAPLLYSYFICIYGITSPCFYVLLSYFVRNDEIKMFNQSIWNNSGTNFIICQSFLSTLLAIPIPSRTIWSANNFRWKKIIGYKNKCFAAWNFQLRC